MGTLKVGSVVIPVGDVNRAACMREYVTKAVLGSGAFGTVWEACKKDDVECLKRYALKVTVPTLHPVEIQDQMISFQREVYFLSKLRDEKLDGQFIVPRLYDAWICNFAAPTIHPPSLMMVMDRWDENMSALTKRRAKKTKAMHLYREHELIRMFRLSAKLGELGIYHGDLKPDQFLTRGEGKEIVISDFGFSGGPWFEHAGIEGWTSGHRGLGCPEGKTPLLWDAKENPLAPIYHNIFQLEAALIVLESSHVLDESSASAEPFKFVGILGLNRANLRCKGYNEAFQEAIQPPKQYPPPPKIEGKKPMSPLVWDRQVLELEKKGLIKPTIVPQKTKSFDISQIITQQPAKKGGHQQIITLQPAKKGGHQQIITQQPAKKGRHQTKNKIWPKVLNQMWPKVMNQMWPKILVVPDAKTKYGFVGGAVQRPYYNLGWQPRIRFGGWWAMRLGGAVTTKPLNDFLLTFYSEEGGNGWEYPIAAMEGYNYRYGSQPKRREGWLDDPHSSKLSFELRLWMANVWASSAKLSDEFKTLTATQKARYTDLPAVFNKKFSALNPAEKYSYAMYQQLDQISNKDPDPTGAIIKWASTPDKLINRKTIVHKWFRDQTVLDNHPNWKLHSPVAITDIILQMLARNPDLLAAIQKS